MNGNDDRTMEPLDFTFIKDRYDFELVRKEQLTTALALPVGLLGALGSALTVMVGSFEFRRDLATWVFGCMVVAAFGSFLACLLQLALAYHRQTYHYLPRLRDLNNKLEEWQAFYETAGYGGAEQDFFNQELRTHIIEAPDWNTENNDARSALLHWARIWLFWLLGFTTLAGLTYIANHVRFHA
jgi:hypothetical protein